MKVGFIGLGDQGAPMARRIIDAGFPTTLWARRETSLTSFRESPAEFASSPRELAAKSELVEICVGGDADVKQVMIGDEGILSGASPGLIVAIHSTVDPETCYWLATKADDVGVTLIDAPVSGTGDAAAVGTLCVIVGGPHSAIETCRPVFASYGNPILHVGSLGSALLAKLVNNALVAANMWAAHGALELGAALGLDSDVLLPVLQCASGRSFGLDVFISSHMMGPRRIVSASTLRKDLDVLMDVSRRYGAESVASDLLGLGDSIQAVLAAAPAPSIEQLLSR